MRWGNQPEPDPPRLGEEPPQPNEAEVVNALLDVERASRDPENPALAPDGSAVPPSVQQLTPDRMRLYLGLAVILVTLSTMWFVGRTAGISALGIKPHAQSSGSGFAPSSDGKLQSRAESLLQKAVAGDRPSADQVIAEAQTWVGHSARSAAINQAITSGINSPDLHVREAALEAQLAVDAVPRTPAGFALLEAAAGDPTRRAWALWTLGAIGQRGVDPTHAAKVIASYLNDPKPEFRAAAVDGLGLLATDETIPLLLERFRSDPSLVVQERAACDLAQSGMYTHAQRVAAAGTMAGWIGDPLLSSQQSLWLYQSLQDISGKNLGRDAAAWRQWAAGAQ